MTDQRETPPAELPALPWPPLLLFGAVVGAWALGHLFPLGWPGVDDEAAHSVGLGIGIAGVALFIWSAPDVAAAWDDHPAEPRQCDAPGDGWALCASGATRSTSPTC